MNRDAKASPKASSLPTHKIFKGRSGPKPAPDCSPWQTASRGSSRLDASHRASPTSSSFPVPAASHPARVGLIEHSTRAQGDGFSRSMSTRPAGPTPAGVSTQGEI